MARVLLVDDDIAEISAVKRVLARDGHQPVLATNAADAIVALAQSAPAVLVVGASCENGDAVRRFAGAHAARGIPMVVLGETASAPEGATQIPRPVDPDQLASQVASALAAAAPTIAAARAPARAGAPARAAGALRAPGAVPAPVRAAAPARTSAGASRRVAAGAASARSNGASGEVASRKAAAEALRARAEELRRSASAAAAAPPQADPGLAAADAALAELASPVSSAAAYLDPRLDPGLEAILRRAEEAERAHAAEKKARARQADRAAVEAHQRVEAEEVAIEKAARARAAEERARKEERARAEAERRALKDAEALAHAEAERRRAEEEARRRAAEEAGRAEEEKRRAEEEKRRAEDESRRAEDESRRAEEEKRRAEEEKRGAAKARERARAEREARVDLEGELDRLRRQSEEEARRREADEEELRAAIASARAEMEALRRRGEEEARRRADAEAEVARFEREAERKIADAAAQPAPFDFPAYRPVSDDPPPDPAQESARRRVAALRERLPAAARPETVEVAPAPDPAPAPRAIRPPPAELRSGTLADVPAPRLLALAARAETSGRIDFEGETSRSVYFEDGQIVGATSADPSDRVEELALRLGLVTRDQYRLVAGAAAPLATRRAAVVLVERGFLKPSELTGLVRRRTEEVVFGVFGDQGARFRWSAAEVPPDERTTLERTSLQLAVEGVRRRWLAPQVGAVLGGDATLLAPVASGPTAADLGLSPEERRALALTDGLRTLDEIVAASPLDPLSTRQSLAALVLVGALAVRTFQGGRPASAATAAIDLARMRDKLDQVRRADYFTILGVGRLCTPHEVREAFERLRAEFDPGRFQAVREEGLDVRLDEIRRVVADARDVLADDRLRDEYLRGLGE